MGLLLPAKAVVYVNHGRLMADCPTGCNNAMDVTSGQTEFLCGLWIEDRNGRRFIGGCGATADLKWPPDPDGILEALRGRPVPNQNWAPAGHRQTHVSYTREGQSVAEAFPHGQTPADLVVENAGG